MKDSVIAAPTAASLSGAHGIFMRELSPLRKVSTELLRDAFRRISTTPVDERVYYSLFKVDRLLKQQKANLLQQLKDEQKVNPGSLAAATAPIPSMLTASSSETTTYTGKMVDRDAQPSQPVAMRFAAGGLKDDEFIEPDELLSRDDAMDSWSASIMAQQIPKYANGSWELMVTLQDTGSLLARRYELGELRRSINLLGSNASSTGELSIDSIAASMTAVETSVGPSGSSTSCLETFPTLWGMGQANNAYSVECAQENQMLVFKGIVMDGVYTVCIQCVYSVYTVCIHIVHSV